MFWCWSWVCLWVLALLQMNDKEMRTSQGLTGLVLLSLMLRHTKLQTRFARAKGSSELIKANTLVYTGENEARRPTLPCPMTLSWLTRLLKQLWLPALLTSQLRDYRCPGLLLSVAQTVKASSPPSLWPVAWAVTLTIRAHNVPVLSHNFGSNSLLSVSNPPMSLVTSAGMFSLVKY